MHLSCLKLSHNKTSHILHIANYTSISKHIISFALKHLHVLSYPFLVVKGRDGHLFFIRACRTPAVQPQRGLRLRAHFHWSHKATVVRGQRRERSGNMHAYYSYLYSVRIIRTYKRFQRLKSLPGCRFRRRDGAMHGHGASEINQRAFKRRKIYIIILVSAHHTTTLLIILLDQKVYESE